MKKTLKAAEADYLSYMEEYYESLSDLEGEDVTEENWAIALRFVALGNTCRARLPAGRSWLRILNVACGKSSLFWDLCVGPADVTGVDIQADTIKHQPYLYNRAAHGHIEERYLRLARRLCRLPGFSELDPVTYVKSIASQATFRQGDLGCPLPDDDDAYDLYISCFGLECLEREAFLFALKEARRVAGRIYIVVLAETETWRLGGETFGCLYVTQDSLRADLVGAGWAIESMEQIPAATAIKKDQGYSQILFVHAVRT